MSAGKHCPCCGQDIGVWRLFRAALVETSVRCPHCSARLRYHQTSCLAEVGLVALTAVIALISFGIAELMSVPHRWSLGVGLGVFFSTFTVIRFFRALYLRRYGVLKIVAAH